MAFAETRLRGNREILESSQSVIITLAELVMNGDVLGYSGGWVRSAHASSEHPLLIALDDGPSGGEIRASQMAVVKVITTSGNVGTAGTVVALNDSGNYVAAGGGLPDVGVIATIGSDSLSATMVIFPQIQQTTSVRA